MSDLIFDIIGEIKNKISLLKIQLEEERSRSKLLQNNIDGLNNELSAKQNELDNLNVEVLGYETQSIAKEKQGVLFVEETNVSDNQIDELVKEIEHCITQLKK